MRRAASCLLAMALTLSGCARSQPHPAPHASGCSLRSGQLQVPVSAAKLDDALTRQRARDETAGAKASDVEHVQRALGQAVADQLWLAIAARSAVHVSDAQMDARMQVLLDQSFMGDASLRAQVLGLTGWTLPAWREHERAVYAYSLAHISDQQAKAASGALTGTCSSKQLIKLAGGAVTWSAQRSLAVYRARPTA